MVHMEVTVPLTSSMTAFNPSFHIASVFPPLLVIKPDVSTRVNRTKVTGDVWQYLINNHNLFRDKDKTAI